jgi:hypothetical protein
MLLRWDECPAQSINIWFKMMKDWGPEPFIPDITIFYNFLRISFESLRKYLPFSFFFIVPLFILFRLLFKPISDVALGLLMILVSTLFPRSLKVYSLSRGKQVSLQVEED